MCGRAKQSKTLQQIADEFGVEAFDLRGYVPKYNVGPSQAAAIVTGKPAQLELMAWGIPITVKTGPTMMINIRKETLEQGKFRKPLLQQRCLFPVDGFYEWLTDGKEKYPFHFVPTEDALFAMPAIYEDVQTPGPPIRTFSIFTTLPNATVAPIHHRMPAILQNKSQVQAWLDPSVKDADPLLALIAPYPDSRMRCFEVSQAVNSGKVDLPNLVQPFSTPRQPKLF